MADNPYDALGRALSGLRSPSSLIGFGAWLVIFSFAFPAMDPVLRILIAAWLGAAVGTAAELLVRRFPSSSSKMAALEQVSQLMDTLRSLPPSSQTVALNLRLQAIYSDTEHGVLHPTEAHEVVNQARGEIVQLLYAIEVNQQQAEKQRALESAREEPYFSKYVAAVSQLRQTGLGDRLGGLHALADLADVWPENSQTCVNALCEYLRSPWDFAETTTAVPTSPVDDELKMRASVLRILGAHLLPGQNSDRSQSWSHLRLDLTGAYLPSLHWQDAEIGEIVLARATFVGDASFDGASFETESVFSGATFTRGVSFDDATFESDAVFDGVKFEGIARFDSASFDRRARFSSVEFCADSWFADASFESTAFFVGAAFRGSSSFAEADFDADVWFDMAAFSGRATFDGTVFRGDAGFSGAVFNQAASFVQTRFQQGLPEGLDEENLEKASS